MSTRRSAVPERADGHRQALAQLVAEHLNRTPRQLPTHLLYDDLGSALFEAICHLPWYAVARTEMALLRRHAAEIHAVCGAVDTVLELGPGSGEKLLTLLAGRQLPQVDTALVDVSRDALLLAERTLSLDPGLRVERVHATYEEGLSDVRSRWQGRTPLVVFLGSNIGNFDGHEARELLRSIRRALPGQGGLLLGTDLVKPESELLMAYDDPLGVTAAFNRNLLLRLNRDLDATFDLAGFGHRAVWNAAASRVEMHLVSLHRQRVTVPAAPLDLRFEPGDFIWTESSHKYRLPDVETLLAAAGFDLAGQWAADGFALTLARAANPA